MADATGYETEIRFESAMHSCAIGNEYAIDNALANRAQITQRLDGGLRHRPLLHR